MTLTRFARLREFIFGARACQEKSLVNQDFGKKSKSRRIHFALGSERGAIDEWHYVM